MIRVDLIAGRLLGIRSVAPITMPDVKDLQEGMAAAFAKLPGKRVVACVDMVDAGVVDQTISDVFKAMLQSDNPLMERSAWLMPVQKPTLALQVERLIREANNQNRQTFTDVGALTKWLSEILDDEERQALKRYVG